MDDDELHQLIELCTPLFEAISVITRLIELDNPKEKP
jgi:hypothetical protein